MMTSSDDYSWSWVYSWWRSRCARLCNNILEQRIASAKTHNTSMVLILLRSFCRELWSDCIDQFEKWLEKCAALIILFVKQQNILLWSRTGLDCPINSLIGKERQYQWPSLGRHRTTPELIIHFQATQPKILHTNFTWIFSFLAVVFQVI